MAKQPNPARDTLKLVLMLGGFVCAVAFGVTPRELVWLRSVWVIGLVSAFMLGAAFAWRRKRFTLHGRYGGTTLYTGFRARLWAVVLALCGSAAAFGAVLSWGVDAPSVRQMGLECLFVGSPLCLSFMLVASGAPQEWGARKRRARTAALFVAFLLFSPMLLMTGFLSLFGAYLLVTGTRPHW